MTPAGTSNDFDVQNEWEENTHNTHVKKSKRGACEQKAATVLPNRTAAT